MQLITNYKNMNYKSMTFDEWKKAGYVIRKGSVARLWNHDGVALFEEDQVSPRTYHAAKDHQQYLYYRYLESENKDRPADHGEDVVGDAGSVIGKRIYHRSITGPEWEKHTTYSDGSGVWHGGGPCGDLYYDEFGNT
jgi:hypothetical protein